MRLLPPIILSFSSSAPANVGAFLLSHMRCSMFLSWLFKLGRADNPVKSTVKRGSSRRKQAKRDRIRNKKH